MLSCDLVTMDTYVTNPMHCSYSKIDKYFDNKNIPDGLNVSNHRRGKFSNKN